MIVYRLGVSGKQADLFSIACIKVCDHTFAQTNDSLAMCEIHGYPRLEFLN